MERFVISMTWEKKNNTNHFLFGQISKAEYVEDFQEPMKKVPELSSWFLLLLLFVPIGTIIYGVLYHLHAKKTLEYQQSVCEAFNEKYQDSRGVQIHRLPSHYGVRVKQLGKPIDGVELFSPLRENPFATTVNCTDPLSLPTEASPSSTVIASESSPSADSDLAAPILGEQVD